MPPVFIIATLCPQGNIKELRKNMEISQRLTLKKLDIAPFLRITLRFRGYRGQSLVIMETGAKSNFTLKIGGKVKQAR